MTLDGRDGAGAGPMLDRNLPCDKCRYNLRGLAPGGRCPECGFAVAFSLAADARRRRKLLGDPPPSSWLAREIVEGAGLSLCAFVLACGLGFLPRSWFKLYTFGRTATMSLTVVAWVLTFAAAFKLTRPDVPAGRSAGPAAWITRAGAVGWLLGAVWFAVATIGLPERGPPLLTLPLLASALCGILLAGLFPLWLGYALGRVGHRWIRALSFPLAAASVWTTLMILPHRGFGPSSLEFLMQAPMPPFLFAELWVALPRLLAPRWDEAYPLGLVGLLNAALLVRLIVAYFPRTRHPPDPAAPDKG